MALNAEEIYKCALKLTLDEYQEHRKALGQLDDYSDMIAADPKHIIAVFAQAIDQRFAKLEERLKILEERQETRLAFEKYQEKCIE